MCLLRCSKSSRNVEGCHTAGECLLGSVRPLVSVTVPVGVACHCTGNSDIYGQALLVGDCCSDGVTVTVALAVPMIGVMT